MAAAGIPVKLANDYTPTPAVSYAVKTSGAAGGVMITSSHNPWNWNGVKFKGNFGGSATPAIMKKVEEEIAGARAMPKGQRAAIEEVDLKPPYVGAVCAFADMDLIGKAKSKIAIDSMYGSGRGILARIFSERGVQYVAIRQEVNPLFPGINPEPIEPHIAIFSKLWSREMRRGLATDGDADRIGAVAEDGSFVDSHKIFCVLLRWLLERRMARRRGARL